MSCYVEVENLDGWNEEALGQLVVDDEETARLVLCRALGLPEPVLYDDIDNVCTKYDTPLQSSRREDDQDKLIDDSGASEEDYEGILNAVVELQERMATGITMIQECRHILSVARAGKRMPYDAFMAWVQREKKLWSHWCLLRKECIDLVGNDLWLWKQYFSLLEVSIDRSGYTDDEIECPDWVWDIYIGKRWLDDSVDDYQE